MAEYIISDEYAPEEQLKQELIRCKDCVHRGNPKKCMLAVICEQNDFPYFFIDNRGEWFCADGKGVKE